MLLLWFALWCGTKPSKERSIMKKQKKTKKKKDCFKLYISTRLTKDRDGLERAEGGSTKRIKGFFNLQYIPLNSQNLASTFYSLITLTET